MSVNVLSPAMMASTLHVHVPKSCFTHLTHVLRLIDGKVHRVNLICHAIMYHLRTEAGFAS